jgi:hypothetical protein
MTTGQVPYYFTLWKTLLLLAVFSAEFCSAQETPENDLCENAIPLTIGDSIASSTIGGSTDELQVNLVRCAEDGTFDMGTPGVWFLLEGTGARVQLSTCAEETNSGSRITVFSGDDCNARACQASTKEPEPNCPFTNSSSLELDTFEGMNYYILVHDLFAADSGNFGLSIADRTEPPENDSCDTAVELVDDSVVQGTTFGATINGGLQCARCIEGGPQNPGVFYLISAKEADTEVSVITCSRIVSFDISIYYGDACDNLVCFEVEPELGLTCSGGEGSKSTWTAAAGRDYYVYIHPEDVEEDLSSSTAAFGIKLIHEQIEDDTPESGTNVVACALWLVPILGALLQ